MKTMQEDAMICVAWKDRKIVHILFNNMDPRELGNVTRREKDGRRKSGVPKWQILIQKTKEEWI
jgi:hypothetical protein